MCSRRGQKYELDCNKWTTYANFDQMFEHTYDLMVGAGLDKLLDTAVWNDVSGRRYNKEDSFRCMAPHNLTHKTINMKCKQRTLLGLISLASNSVMCVLIFAGVRPQAVMETGMDIFAEQVGDVSDEFYFKNSS